MNIKRKATVEISGVDKASRAFKSIDRQWQRFTTRMRAPLIAVAGTATAAAAAYGLLIRSGVRYNAELENYRDILTSVFRSQERANEEMQAAIAFAAQTPYAIPEIVEATARLETYGIAAREVLGAVGDMAAATGKSLMSAVEAYVDASVGEFERLKEFGIRKEMLVPYGLRLDTKGAIEDLGSVTTALFAFMSKWEGQMNVMSTSFRGMASNLRDVWSGMLGMLAQPLFDQLKIEMRGLLDWIAKIRAEGQLDKILQGWAEAGQLAMQRMSAAISAAGPAILDWIQQSGKAVADFIRSLNIEQIKQTAKQLADMASTVGRVAISIAKLVAHNWKLIAAFAGLAVISKIALSIISFGKAVAAAIPVIKGFAIALAASLGPTGWAIAAAVAGIAALGVAVWKFSSKTDDAVKSVGRLAREIAKIEYESIVGAASEGHVALVRLGTQIKTHEGIMRRYIQEGYKVDEMWQDGVISMHDYEKQQAVITAQVMKHEQIAERLRKSQAGLYKELKPLGPIRPPPDRRDGDDDAERAAQKVIAQRAKLALELQKFTADETAYRIAEVQRWAKTEIAAAEGNAENIRTIERIMWNKITQIRRNANIERAKAEQERIEEVQSVAQQILDINQRMAIDTLRAEGRERDARAAELRGEAARKLELLGGSAQAQAQVEKWLTSQIGAMDAEIIKAAEDKNARILAADQQLYLRTLEMEGKTAQAAYERLQMEVEQMREAGYKQIAIERYTQAVLKGIRDQAAAEQEGRWNNTIAMFSGIINALKDGWNEALLAHEAAEKEVQGRINELRMSDFEREMMRIDAQAQKYAAAGVDEVQIAAWAAAEKERIRADEVDRLYQLESDMLSRMQSEYESYMQTVLSLGDILFSAQEQGWQRTIASLVQWGSRLLSEYMLAQAHEKALQKAKLETASLEARLHSEYMAAKAAQYALEGDIFRATAAGWQALTSAGRAAALKTEAELMGTQAKSLTVAAVAVKGAGELAARGFNASARASEEAARRAEQRARSEEQIRMRIMEMEGREADVQRHQLQAQIAEYEQAGIDVGLLRRLEKLEMAQIQPVVQQQVTQQQIIERQPAAQPLAVGGGSVQQVRSGPTVYQTVTFNKLVDTKSADDLREIAVAILPFVHELEDKYKE